MYKGTGERASLTHGEANRSSWLEATKQWEKQNEGKEKEGAEEALYVIH